MRWVGNGKVGKFNFKIKRGLMLLSFFLSFFFDAPFLSNTSLSGSVHVDGKEHVGEG